MDVQFLIVMLILAAAGIFAAAAVVRRIRSFSPKRQCGNDCGCSSNSKALRS